MKFPKLPALLLIPVAALFFTAGCASVVERGGVANLKVTPMKVPGRPSQVQALQITGTTMDSAAVVVSIRERKHGKNINLIVREALATSLTPGKSGTFGYTLKLPGDVTVVTFGKNQSVLWIGNGSPF